MDIKHWLKQNYFGNDIQQWVIALAIALGLWFGLYITRRVVVSRLSRLAAHTRSHIDDVIVATIQATRSFFLFSVASYVGIKTLELPKEYGKPLNIGLLCICLLQGGFWLQAVFRNTIKYWQARRIESPGAQTMAGAITFLGQLLIWTLVGTSVISHLGVKIGAIVTGLGIGGLAAALAVQNILGDFFASLALYFDTPFDIGDFIATNNNRGTVEKIGIRSTRLRALSGEQLIFPNADLAKSLIQNFKRMDERRIMFEVGVEYGTPSDALKRIPTIIKEAIESEPSTRFERSHFKAFGDNALIYETVYFLLTSDYNEYMDRQQTINLAIYEKFENEDVNFAFPTRTVHIHDTSQRSSDASAVV